VSAAGYGVDSSSSRTAFSLTFPDLREILTEHRHRHSTETAAVTVPSKESFFA
jgi:hypothetical protein